MTEHGLVFIGGVMVFTAASVRLFRCNAPRKRGVIGCDPLATPWPRIGRPEAVERFLQGLSASNIWHPLESLLVERARADEAAVWIGLLRLSQF